MLHVAMAKRSVQLVSGKKSISTHDYSNIELNLEKTAPMLSLFFHYLTPVRITSKNNDLYRGRSDDPMPFFWNIHDGKHEHVEARRSLPNCFKPVSNEIRQLALGLNNSLKIIYILILYSNRRPHPPVPFPADELLREGVKQGNRALIELSD